ncbi:unnamed protein product [Prorocentrum cordatum]|uniref:Protein kinase domain-containing protein n=1 Tax=Prorocentrum cordatum TaxID=2364126 RepID=A0ABN9UZ55_9DINO|nr:unnamed protein product [Polarella glacialis]
MRSVLRFLRSQGAHRDCADFPCCSPPAEAYAEGDAVKALPSEDDGGSTRCPTLDLPGQHGDARDACLAEAMQGMGDADAARWAWGAELGMASEDVTIEKVIASGSTSEVFCGAWQGRQVAVKRLTGGGQKRASAFVRELGVMSRQQHPNLVRLLGFCHDEGAFDMVLEFCRGGSLFHLLHTSEVDVVPTQQLKVARDVAEGMVYLHGLATPVLHRDLKSLNIVLQEPVCSPGDVPLAKVTDFGLAKIRMGPAQHGVARPIGGEPGQGCDAAATSRLSTPCAPFVPGSICDSAEGGSDWAMTRSAGTLQWMAPEILAGRTDYYLEVDVYAYGMLLFEIMCFEPPFVDMEAAEVSRLVLQGVRPKIDVECATAVPLEKLTRACWAQEPSERPTFFSLKVELEGLA